MATPFHARAVKSLNKSPGRRRFVFKTKSQQLEDIDINVFRSLDKIKAVPSEGSSFFRDCLIEWRELNTAEDFISFYEEMMPFVQTLPLVLLHKELIFSKLQSRLHMKARLSLEPILRLMAAFSRDLLEDFIPFLPRLVNTIVALLNSGGDKEPETIEQIFMSLSYTMMYLQKYLVLNVVHVLKVTHKLRYYPKDYVQEFMAEAVSFLLRNAPDELFTKCVKKIMLEVVKKPLVRIKTGVTALLFYIMRGTSTTLHSKAGRVFKLLMGDSIFAIGDKFKNGSAVVEVVIAALERLCQELESEELDLMWNYLYKKINESATNKYLLHLGRLLSILISALKIEKGRRVSDYKVTLECVDFLVHAFIAAPSDTMEVDGHLSGVVDKVLQLMSCILDGLQISNDVSTISVCSLQWAPAFQLRNSSLLTFIQELIQKDHYILDTFRVNVLSALNNLIDSSEEEVIGLLLTLCERLRGNSQSSKVLDNTSGGLSRIHEHLQQGILNWIRTIKDIIEGNSLSNHIDEARLTVLWGIISCYPHMLDVQADSSLLIDLVGALNRFLVLEAGNLAGIPRSTWQSLFGAALSSLYSCRFRKSAENGETVKVLDFAKAYKSCPQVLSAVADYLDYLQGPSLQADGSIKVYHPELKAEKAVHALDIFSENLSHSNRQMRVATLRILCQYEPLGDDTSAEHEPLEKKMKTEGSQACHAGSNVLELFLSIEATPLSISTSRKVILLISRVQMDLSAGRISETYIPLVLYGIIGIFHNRFSYLWNPACECLAVLIKKHTGLVWEKFINYFGRFQASFLISNCQIDGSTIALSDKSVGLLEHFNSFVSPPADGTPSATVLSSVLQSLQKVPLVAESKSVQIIPLFLKFLGYDTNDLSVGSFNSRACRGKEWKGVFKEWLNLLKHMRNPKSFSYSQFVKDILQNRLLDDSDAEIQMLVLECLLMWKDNSFVPYDQHLQNLINPKALREEITTWSLSRESCQVEEGHRAHLVPLVIRLLIPKIRKLKTLASRKHASMQNRRALLAFIAQVDIDELPLFFALLIKPLQITSKDSVDLFWNIPGSSMGEFQAFNFLKYFTVENITSLPWKKRYGFMHVIQHILGVFDELHVRPFLDLLMGCVVRVLVSCTRNLDGAKGDASPILDLTLHGEDNTVMNHSLTTMLKQFKELRSLCLKIVSFVLNKYEDHDFGCEFWNLFFTSVKPLIKGFKQEGSSSEKPSSLFSCFLAMSRCPELTTLLHREKNLVPDIFSILMVSTASEAIKCCVLKFIENLLNLDSELDDDDTAVKSLLLPNLEVLICSLHCHVQRDNASKRTSHKYLGGNEVRIFKLLSKYIKDPLQARTFIDILLPFLAKRIDDSDACPQALQVIQDIIPALGIESTAKILNAVSPLLITVSPDVRFCICDLLDTLAKVDSSVLSVAKLIRELNSTSKMEVDGLDDDAIINTYEKINIQFFITIGDVHASVILSQCIFDMSSEELVLRQSAYSMLLSFIEFSVLILGQENGSQYESGEMMKFDRSGWTRACILRLINKLLLKHIGDAMSQGNSVKKEWIDLLRDMVLKLPDDANVSSFKALCSDDAEVDFFYNIVHLQKHRRARALLRFKNIISKNKLPEGILKNIFVPLFFSMLLDLQDGKDEHVRAACMEALASVSFHMEWKSYCALLNRCFREMRKNANKQKVLVRLVCAVLDQFHFSQPVLNQVGEESLVNVSAGNMNEIRSCLHKTFLPKIQKLMTSDTDSINVNISLAAVKILKLLPGNIMDLQLPSVIHKICNSLKNRSEGIRGDARMALAACLKELGLEYLQYVVKVLRATLKRGYELHVLGYTLNFILSKYLLNRSVGTLDYCLEDLISVVENDILGEVAEEKEVEKIASKMKETKKCKSFESLKLIAQNITFRSHALKLLTPVKAQLQKHLTPKVKAKLESMLDHIAAGIEFNPSVELTDLFTFIYGLLEDGIKEENVLCEDSIISGSKKDQENQISGKTIPKVRVIITRSVGSHLITVFALALLHNRVKNAKLNKNDIQLLSMLDPFIRQLGNCLSSQYENILSLSLRCLTLLVRLPLPSLASLGDKIKVTLLDIAQSSINSSSPLMQSCLKLLTVLLQSTKITLSSDQLHLLIQFPIFDDLERNTSFVALSLLKAIVNRKLVVHEIYDLMTRVAELMVTSQVESIRKKCSQILLQFLLDYHLSRKRLEEHLSTLLANLRYEHSSGRETVLEMLCAIVMKFPKSVIDEQSLTFFIHLVFCLVNDQDTKVRSMIGAAIKLLTGRISSHSLNSILDYILPLYSFEQHKEKPQLCGAAAQVLGLLVEVMKENFQKHVDQILVVVGQILQSAVEVGLHQDQDCSDEATLTFWNDAYYSLVMLEKFLYQFHDLCFKRDLEDIWEEISKLLLHPHLWLRNRSNRLLALYFTTVTEAIRENPENSFGIFILMRPAKIFMIAISLCCQLKAQITNDDTANNLLTQNIAFAILSLPSSMGQNDSVAPHKLWSALEQHEQAQLLKAFQSLDPGKGKGIFLGLISGMYSQNEEGQFKDLQSFLISYLLKRMGKLSLEMDAIQMKIVFNVFKNLSLQLSPDNCHSYAFQMLLPVYKVSEGFAGKIVSDDLKQLAQEVCESIRNTLGIQTFVQLYQDIRKSLKAKRDKRKHEEKVMAVVNPMRNAKRKLRIASKHRANKKRKIMTMKMARWMR